MDDSLPTAAMLFSGSNNFSCTVKDSSGGLVGSLAWNSASQTLTIDGTIFIDGDINIPSGTVNYTGNGTIYINGSLNGGQPFNGTNICGPAQGVASPSYGCPGNWNYPTTDPPAAGTGSLEFVFINPNNVSTPVDLTGSGKEWDVTLFIVNGFTSTGGTTVKGPILADGGSMNGHVGLAVPPFPPKGAPITKQIPANTANWGVTAGNWKQLQ